jgi:hypothetical protein
VTTLLKKHLVVGALLLLSTVAYSSMGWALASVPAQTQSVVTQAPLTADINWPHLPAPWLQASTPTSQSVTLGAVLQQALPHDPDIAASREKTAETLLKQVDIKRRRLLLFFRYFTPESLDGATDADVTASQAHTEGIVQTLTLQTIQQYQRTVQALLADYGAMAGVKQAQLQLASLSERFKAGQVTLPDVLRGQRVVLDKMDAYVVAHQQAQGLGHALAVVMALPEGANAVAPSDLGVLWPAEIKATGTAPVSFSTTLPPLSGLIALSKALPSLRPDVQECHAKMQSLQQLVNSTAPASLPHKILASSLTQLTFKAQRLEQQASLALYNAQQTDQLNASQLAMAQQHDHVAQKTLSAVALSYKAGFSSLNQYKEALTACEQARLSLISKQWDALVAQAQVLYQQGQLHPSAVPVLDPAIKPLPTSKPRRGFWQRLWPWTKR